MVDDPISRRSLKAQGQEMSYLYAGEDLRFFCSMALTGAASGYRLYLGWRKITQYWPQMHATQWNWWSRYGGLACP